MVMFSIVLDKRGMHIFLLFEPAHDKTYKMTCAPSEDRLAWASTQSDQSSLCAQWVAKDPSFLHANSEDSDQPGQMPRMICLHWRTCHFVDFVMRWLISP